MMNNNTEGKCLFCYEEITDGNKHYHPKCAKKMFGTKHAPLLPYTRDNIEELAIHILENSTSITGVQPKLALDINRGGKNEPDKLTIVGLWGNYILKPQSSRYRSMPELEDLTMKLARLAGIRTAMHGLIMMQDGELAYITRRMDRGDNGEKHSMLDMCQLTNRLTEHKYRGAYSQLAETIKRYSVTPMLDVQHFWEIVIFSWITGNSDMHCKNFSLIKDGAAGYRLSPAYDLLAVLLTGINDCDELAMPLVGSGTNGNRPIGGFNRTSFIEAMKETGIAEKIANKTIDRLTSKLDKWLQLIDKSFLSQDLKSSYKSMILERTARLRV